jgi:hypothetical protein
MSIETFIHETKNRFAFLFCFVIGMANSFDHVLVSLINLATKYVDSLP